MNILLKYQLSIFIPDYKQVTTTVGSMNHRECAAANLLPVTNHIIRDITRKLH
jgi:hypothetical protein